LNLKFIAESVVFTGIIEETGIIRDLRFVAEGAVIAIASETIPATVKIGESIAINGVCLTATHVEAKSFLCDISPETLQRSAFQKVKKGDVVNLERSLMIGDRLGGHFVLGHVDDAGKLTGKISSGDGFEMSFDFPQRLERYLVHKGSIAVNGISLTISSLGKGSFSVAVIPHTYRSTNLSRLMIGDAVNLEVDILGKYFERFFQLGVTQDSKADSKLTADYLKSQGF
jgi:riboflavin synthase